MNPQDGFSQGAIQNASASIGANQPIIQPQVPDFLSQASQIAQNRITQVHQHNAVTTSQFRQTQQQAQQFVDSLGNNPQTDSRSPGAVTGGHDYAGLCQKWVDDTLGIQDRQPTAIAAFNNYANKGQAFNNLSQAKPGDLIYFNGDSSNQGAGHVGILTDPQRGIMKSATYGGIREDNISNWMSGTGQTIAGFARPS